MIAWAAHDLTVRYRSRDWLGRTREHTAVRDVSFSLRAGERVALIGQSGSGKTSLVRAALGLLPFEGRLTVLGEDATRWSRRRWHAARQQAQLLFQDPRAMLAPDIPLGLLLRESAALHRPEQAPDAAVAEMLSAVDLAGREDALPHELSGGERRRAGVARVLLARPRLLVADEPTAGLDAASKADLVRLLVERAGPDCAILIVSHDLPTVAWATERVLVLHDGALVDDLPSACLVDPDHPRHFHTAALLAAAGMLPTSPPEVT